jgi:hypothetical protein
VIVVGVATALLALARAPWCRELPAGPVLFCVAGLSGALVARGTAYVGRFSVHLMPVSVALATSFGARVLGRIRRPMPMRAA